MATKQSKLTKALRQQGDQEGGAFGRQATAAAIDSFELRDGRTDYQERRVLAREVAAEAGAGLAAARSLAPEEVAVYVEAFTDAATSAWSHTLSARERARSIWRKITSGLTLDQVTAKLRSAAETMTLRGATVSDSFGGVTLRAARGYALDGAVTLRFERDYDAKVVNPDDANQTAGGYTVKAEVSWSSTTRDVTSATAAVALYRELVDAAAELEYLARAERVVWTFGVPEEPAAEVANG